MQAPLVDFGYLTVTLDFSGASPQLTIAFSDRSSTRKHDTLRLDLTTGAIQ